MLELQRPQWCSSCIWQCPIQSNWTIRSPRESVLRYLSTTKWYYFWWWRVPDRNAWKITIEFIWVTRVLSIYGIYFLETGCLGHNTGRWWELNGQLIAFGHHGGTISNVVVSRLDIVAGRFEDGFCLVRFVGQTPPHLVFSRIDCIAECKAILLIALTDVGRQNQSSDIV